MLSVITFSYQRWMVVSIVYLWLASVHGRRHSFSYDEAKTRPVATFHSRVPTSRTTLIEPATMTETSVSTTPPPPSLPKDAIQVAASIELPFPRSVAYDAFADLSRQTAFSPWLQSVEYLTDQKDAVGALTQWKLSYLGVRLSWHAICTVLDRPNGIIEWKSVHGLPNQGRVVFSESGAGGSRMHMTMCLSLPRVAARLMGPGKLASMVEDMMLARTVQNFRHIVAENDWKRVQEQAQAEVP